MAYSNFTLDTAREAFGLEEIDAAGIFADFELVVPSELLTAVLARNIPLATAIGTEKAKSEMIVADVLVELREQLEHRISLFSGIDFNVDPENGLAGVCDFVVSLSPRQFSLTAPVIILVEAKTIIWRSDSDSASQRWWLPNALMPKKEITFRASMVPRLQGQSGDSSNWRVNNSTLICLSIKLNAVTKSSVSSQAW